MFYTSVSPSARRNGPAKDFDSKANRYESVPNGASGSGRNHCTTLRRFASILARSRKEDGGEKNGSVPGDGCARPENARAKKQPHEWPPNAKRTGWLKQVHSTLGLSVR